MTTVSYKRGDVVEAVPASVRSSRRSKWDSLYMEAQNVEGEIVPFILADGKQANEAAVYLRSKGLNVAKRGSAVYVNG